MDDQPPRRSRRSTPLKKNDSVPLVPILIGVIVLGFIIGAGLSLVGKRGGDPASQSVAVVTAAPTTAQPTLAPVTPAPTDPPTPIPTDPPAAIVSPDVASPVPATRAPATHAPATHAPTQSPVTAAPSNPPATSPPRTSAPATPTARAAASVARPVTAPRAVVTPARVANASPVAPTDAPPSSDDADSEFAKLATSVVRQYVAAIARGDDATATAAFGPDAAGNVKLIESGVIDSSTHISHVEARSAGDNVTVNVDLKSPKGLLFGQYTVHRTPSGAALITDHAINRL